MTPFPVHAGVGAHPEVTRQPPLSAPLTPPGRDGGAAGGSDRTQGVIDRVQTAVGVAAGQDPRGSRRAGSSATLLRPPLYEKKGRSGGRKSEVKGKGRSRHGSAGRVSTYVTIS